MQTKYLKDVHINELAVIKYVFNNCVKITTLILKVLSAIIGVVFTIKYISLGIFALYQSNSVSILYLSGGVSVALSLIFWFFMRCYNSVEYIENKVDIAFKTKYSFKKIIKSTLIIKCVFYVILLTSWSRISGDDSNNLIIFCFMILSAIEHLLNMVCLDDFNDEIKKGC